MGAFLQRSVVGLFLLTSVAAAAPDDADDRASLVDGLYERGMYDMVVSESEGFLTDHAGHPRSEVIRYRLASALFELDRKEEAVEHFEFLGERPGFPYRAEASLRLGQCELEAGRLNRAYKALERVLELDADYLEVPATFLMAEVDFQRGRFQEAEPRYRDVLKKDPEGDFGLDAASSLAWCAYRLGKYDKAVEYANTILGREIEPSLATEMHFLVGESELEAGRNEAAIAAYKKVESGPFADAALRGSGFAYAALDDHGQAAKAFETLLKDHGDSRFAGEASLRLGVHRLLNGNPQGAWQALDAEIVADDAEALYWKGRTRGDLGDVEGALALLEEALGAQPDEELTRHIQTVRGDLLTDAGRSSEAAEAYANAGSSEALHAAAVASFNAGDAARALELSDSVIAQGKQEPAVLLTRAEALFELDRHAEAIPSFEAVLQSDATELHARAASRLAWCHYVEGRVPTAANIFAKIVRDHPESPEAEEASYMEGRSWKEAGKDPAAIKAWEGYVARFPQGEHTAEVLMSLSEITEGEQARKHLATLTRDHGESPLVTRALLDLADGLTEEGNLEQAEQHYSDILERFPDNELASFARYGLAWCLVERDATAEAAEQLDWFLSSEPGLTADAELRGSALELLIWCEGQQGRPQGAQDAWTAFAELKPAPDALLNGARTVSDAWKAADKPDQAIQVYGQLAQLAPAVMVECQVEAGWILLDIGQLAQAEARLSAATAEAPDDDAVIELSFFLAEALFAKNEDGRALPLYASVSGHAEHRLAAEALYKEGFARLRNKDPQGAQPLFERLAKDYPESPLKGEALYLAGEAAFRQQQYETAANWLRQMLDESPQHDVASKARFRLGLSLAQLEQWTEAESVLADLARTEPDFPNIGEAELWRARALANLGNDRAAAAAFQRVVDHDRGVLAARAQIGIGELERRAGNTETALSTFLKVAVLYGHSEEVAQALFLAGQCLEDLGDQAKAKDRYKEIVDNHPQSTVAEEARRRLSGS